MNIKHYKCLSNDYLLKNDLINKYSLKNVFVYPKISNIKLRISSVDLMNSLTSLSSKD